MGHICPQYKPLMYLVAMVPIPTYVTNDLQGSLQIFSLVLSPLIIMWTYSKGNQLELAQFPSYLCGVCSPSVVLNLMKDRKGVKHIPQLMYETPNRPSCWTGLHSKVQMFYSVEQGDSVCVSGSTRGERVGGPTPPQHCLSKRRNAGCWAPTWSTTTGLCSWSCSCQLDT